MSSVRTSLRIGNKMVTPLIRLGIRMGPRRAPMALLGVEGRKSGMLRTTPVALAEFGDGWLLVAVYGVCDWSRNLEAAGRATITRLGRTIAVGARRLPPSEAAPVLRDSIADAPALIRRMTASHFWADLSGPIADWEAEAAEHPVFVLDRLTAGFA